ncbi:MAG TPA: helix-turn-helix domain-containing protein [Candidatus Limiplasma sp.]|nr:helix-turn-helix domain-containing protein [Candidatus Limiplasma sp.]HRX09129.1 helix-turn-helix domain-containing protein [Candidatus Limiplasma sp.]
MKKMKNRPKKKATLITKLTLSYFLIITLMAALLSITFVYVSNVNYTRDAQKLNSLILCQIANVISSNILAPVDQFVLNFISANDSGDTLNALAEDFDLLKVSELCTKLSYRAMSSQNLMSSIHIYFKEDDFVASSSMGYKRNTTANRIYWPYMTWFEPVQLLRTSNTYFTLRSIQYHQTASAASVMTFIYPYPLTQPFYQADAMIAVDVPLTYLVSMLSRMSSEDSRMLLLLDADGQLILNNADPSAPTSVQALGYETNAECLAAEANGVFATLGDSRTLRSCAMLPNGWLIVSFVPADSFLAVNRIIIVAAVVITSITVLIFLLISRIFAFHFYAPVKKLMSRAKHLLMKMEQEDGSNADEFAQVDAVLTEMEKEILNLSRNWEENLPTLKLAFMRSITEGEPISKQNFDKQLLYHTRQMSDAQYRILLLFLSPNDDENYDQPVTDALISYIERQSNVDNAYIAYERSENCVCALALSSGELAKSKMQSIISYARRFLSVDITMGVGGSCTTPTDIHVSFEQALEAYKHSYFEEWNNLFIFTPLPKLRGDTQAELMADLKAYTDALDKDDQDELEMQIQVSMEHIISAKMNCTEKHLMLSKYVEIIKVRMRGGDERFTSPQSSSYFPNISAFSAWLTQASTFILYERSDESRTRIAVESVVKYIHNNLSQELSLTKLSEYTMLSNNYLSRIFKEHMGINLVDYVTKCRMTKAAEMLTETRLPVEQIARALGYNTPHYFSKRFRENYGLTPNQFRLR